MLLIISTSYKLQKKIPNYWYFLEIYRTFASLKVSNNSIN